MLGILEGVPNKEGTRSESTLYYRVYVTAPGGVETQTLLITPSELTRILERAGKQPEDCVKLFSPLDYILRKGALLLWKAFRLLRLISV